MLAERWAMMQRRTHRDVRGREWRLVMHVLCLEVESWTLLLMVQIRSNVMKDTGPSF